MVPALRFSVLTLALCATATLADTSEDAIRKRLKEIKASDNQAWRKIPWSASLLDARRVSADEKRPVFLFTHDGNIDTGRC